MVLSYSAHSIMYVELAAFIVFVSLSGDRSEYSERLQRGAGWLDGWLDGFVDGWRDGCEVGREDGLDNG